MRAPANCSAYFSRLVTMKRNLYRSESHFHLLVFVLLVQVARAEHDCHQDHQSSYCSLNGAAAQAAETDRPATSHMTLDVPTESCFRAAVVEYSRVDIDGDCRSNVNANLDILEKAAGVGHENGAKMLVFPEDGLLKPDAGDIVPCLEEIPDPETLTDSNGRNPCESNSAGVFQNTPILTRLSCIARRYKLYLIANFGTRQPCDNNSSDNNTSDLRHRCFAKGRDFMMLNTNVVLDPQGQFVSRYRKWHPFFGSEIFDKAPSLEHSHFDTPFGRFGLFTCFDMIYKEPAVSLVETYGIDTAVFPTWWYDELPILTAIQYQDGWSATHRVNLLAANILKRPLGSTGSGIFSGNNTLYVSQSGAYSRQGGKTKVLIANLKSRPRSATECACEDNFEPKIVDLDENQTNDVYKALTYNLLEGDKIETLRDHEATKTLCSGEFCCTLDYKIASDTEPSEISRLIFIVRDGRRPGLYRWHEQACALSVLKGPARDTAELVRSVAYEGHSSVRFLELSLRAKFNTKYVYPSTARDVSNLLERRRRRLVCKPLEENSRIVHDCRLDLVAPFSAGQQTKSATQLYAFAMYGRPYEQDPAEMGASGSDK